MTANSDDEKRKTEEARKEISSFIGHDLSSTREQLICTIVGELAKLCQEIEFDRTLEKELSSSTTAGG